MKKYIPSDIEPKWQNVWAKDKLYQTDKDTKEKKYILDMFPYPSGDGLHVGHLKGYTATDIISRYFRLKGYRVLHPMGWDAFGLPAENYAIKTGVHPKITTAKNISNIKAQMERAGLSYDWSRELNTTHESYYKWTQWIFLKLFEAGLAYEGEAPINFCPSCKTGLANEEVVSGKCERCGTPVEKKQIRQWILRITKYADRLLEGLKDLDWPQPIKDMQINWIGRKEGINITYKIEGQSEEVVVFTTRPDTNFGATFIVIGPEHPLIYKVTDKKYLDAVKEYIGRTKDKSEEERIAQGRAKTGVFTGSYAINNLNGKKMPIWVSDFVLGDVGTGAVVGVPGHDLRDFEFAKTFNLQILRVVVGKDGDVSEITQAEQVQEKEGVMVNSDFLNGKDILKASQVIMDYLEEKGWGKKVVNYHLRDWLFSRQRYWGEPIPIVHCDKCNLVPLPESSLPLKLPEIEKYQPTGTGESPLASISEWVNTTCPKCGGPAKRETNTMPQWAGSCWYYLRFCDPDNDKVLVDKQVEKNWLPVDWYVGGAEHAVLHLLYARFWHKFLFDIGIITTEEPFYKLRNVGLVLASDGTKMSKSKGNVINPNQIIEEYGADTLRVYESFMGPFENAIAWDPASINGVYRFLNRVWEVIIKESSSSTDKLIDQAINKLIFKVGEDIEGMEFNTAVASMMEFINLVYAKGLTLEHKKVFLTLLSPFAPHITEELWSIQNGKLKIENGKSELSIVNSQLSNARSIHKQHWPKFNDNLEVEDEVNIVIQINGKLRDSFTITKDLLSDKEAVFDIAIDRPKIQKFVTRTAVKNYIYVPGRILNLVTF